MLAATLPRPATLRKGLSTTVHGDLDLLASCRRYNSSMYGGTELSLMGLGRADRPRAPRRFASTAFSTRLSRAGGALRAESEGTRLRLVCAIFMGVDDVDLDVVVGDVCDDDDECDDGCEGNDVDVVVLGF